VCLITNELLSSWPSKVGYDFLHFKSKVTEAQRHVNIVGGFKSSLDWTLCPMTLPGCRFWILMNLGDSYHGKTSCDFTELTPEDRTGYIICRVWSKMGTWSPCSKVTKNSGPWQQSIKLSLGSVQVTRLRTNNLDRPPYSWKEHGSWGDLALQAMGKFSIKLLSQALVMWHDCQTVPDTSSRAYQIIFAG
jgi:hypothetical protein